MNLFPLSYVVFWIYHCHGDWILVANSDNWILQHVHVHFHKADIRCRQAKLVVRKHNKLGHMSHTPNVQYYH